MASHNLKATSLLLTLLLLSTTPLSLSCSSCPGPTRPTKPHKPHPPTRPNPPPKVGPIILPPIGGSTPPVVVNPPIGGSTPPVVVNPPIGGSAPPVVGNCPPSTPAPPKTSATCPVDTLKLGACVDLLGGLVHIGLGDPVANQCCPLIQGLVEIEAAVCLCTTIKLKLLNINIYLPLALQLLLTCGKAPPPGYTCTI